jgi:hypothetical protein
MSVLESVKGAPCFAGFQAEGREWTGERKPGVLKA